MFAKFDEVFKGFVKKIDKFKKYNGYKYFLGKNNGLENKKYDDFNGPIYTDGFNWPFESDEVWFKGKIVIPAEIAGIRVRGSHAILFYRVACSSVLYINRKKKVDEKWWITTDIPLSDSLKSGEAFDITICLKKIEGCGYFQLPQVIIEKVEDVFLKIDTFLNTLKFIKRLIELGKIKEKNLVNFYRDILSRAPIELLRDGKTMDFTDYIRETELSMKQFSPYLKKYCTYLVGHAHLDMNWLWDWENTLDTARRTFLQVEKFMKQDRDFCFSQSQAALYKAMEENYPDIFKNIKKRVREGRWEITASTWVEGDLNMASGESLIRQILLAKEYTREKFGIESQVCWSPDTFGHPASYPQILKKCGINYYFFCRCGKTAPIFYWEGIDGSRVLALNEPNGYNHYIASDIILRFDNFNDDWPVGGFVNSREDFHVNKMLFTYGIGDHGGGPTIRDINSALAIKSRSLFTGVRFSTVQKFFKDVERTMKDIPVIRGELNYVFEGCYTMHAEIKKYNRQCENLLVTAEIFALLASLYGLNYPQDKLKKAWQNTCFNQFHDIMDGCNIHSSYDYSRQIAGETIAEAGQVIKDGTEFISSLISLPENDAIPLVIFNPLSWERDDIVEIELSGAGNGWVVEDVSGNEMPSQTFKGRLFFNARQVPSLGYKTYFLKKPAKPLNERLDIETAGVFENERYLLEIEPATGGIKRLFNKTKKKELFKCLEQGNVFKLYTEMEHGMSSWKIGEINSVKTLLKNTKIKKTIKGPVMDVIETECLFENSKINQEIIFFKAHDRIEFRTKLLWQELGAPGKGIPMLKVSFPLNIISTMSAYEVPFGVVERPNDGQESPALKWVDYSDGKFGVALLNDSKYGYNVQGNRVELTLVRSAYEPDLNPDAGEHSFTYTVYPHEGKWQKGKVVRKGYELNVPFIPVMIDKMQRGNGNKILPLQKTFVKTDSENVVISSLKKAEDSKGFVLHAYETEGKTAKGNFYFGWDIGSVKETDLLENAVSLVSAAKNRIRYKFRKWEIKSFRGR